MEERKENAAPECRKNSDLRTFMIALLTAVIVVALYHFGSGLCKIYCPESCGGYYPTQRYMLVPVMDVPMPVMDEGAMHRPGQGKFGMRRPGGFRDGGARPDWKRGPGFKGKRPDGQFGPRGEFKGPKGYRGPNGPKRRPAKADAPEAKPAPAADAKPAPAPEAKTAADAKPAPAPEAKPAPAPAK